MFCLQLFFFKNNHVICIIISIIINLITISLSTIYFESMYLNSNAFVRVNWKNKNLDISQTFMYYLHLWSKAVEYCGISSVCLGLMFMDFLDYPYSQIYELNLTYIVVCKNTNGLDTSSKNLRIPPPPRPQFMSPRLFNKIKKCLTLFCNEPVTHEITYSRISKQSMNIGPLKYKWFHGKGKKEVSILSFTDLR